MKPPRVHVQGKNFIDGDFHPPSGETFENINPEATARTSIYGGQIYLSFNKFYKYSDN